MQRTFVRRVVVALCLGWLMCTVHAQKYTVTGGQGTPLLALDNNSGSASDRLQVYLVYGMEHVEIRYTPTSGSYQWYRFKNKALDREAIPSVEEGGETVVRNLEEGYGYYVQEGESIGSVTGYIWLIDYSQYAFTITDLYVDKQRSNCEQLYLGGSAEMKEMSYNNPATGYSTLLERPFDITYQTMKLSDDRTSYMPETVTKTIKSPFNTPIAPPLCDTDITLKGDLFARHFGVEKTMTTEVYQTVSVEAEMKIDTLLYTDAPNRVLKGDSLSAPVEFNFKAVANTPVAAIFKWEIFKKEEMEGDVEEEGIKLVDFNGEEVSYLFNQNGTYTIRLTVSDRTSQCRTSPAPVTIHISDFFLDVPNAFSPGTSPGINDEFRVAYRSLTRFKCWIFNRWGAEMYYWTDPSKGWDGKKEGKYVAPGVYFYVIEATTSSGKTIKKKGSINILRSKQIQDEVIEK